jgi:hypothetical protein
MGAAKAEGFDRAELISPDGTRTIFERKAQHTNGDENTVVGTQVPPTEELEI